MGLSVRVSTGARLRMLQGEVRTVRRERNTARKALGVLVDAVRSSQPEAVSNDLGNALDEAERVLGRRS